jgi:hypothetical protein
VSSCPLATCSSSSSRSITPDIAPRPSRPPSPTRARMARWPGRANRKSFHPQHLPLEQRAWRSSSASSPSSCSAEQFPAPLAASASSRGSAGRGGGRGRARRGPRRGAPGHLFPVGEWLLRPLEERFPRRPRIPSGSTGWWCSARRGPGDHGRARHACLRRHRRAYMAMLELAALSRTECCSPARRAAVGRAPLRRPRRSPLLERHGLAAASCSRARPQHHENALRPWRCCTRQARPGCSLPRRAHAALRRRLSRRGWDGLCPGRSITGPPDRSAPTEPQSRTASTTRRGGQRVAGRRLLPLARLTRSCSRALTGAPRRIRLAPGRGRRAGRLARGAQDHPSRR